MNDLDLWQFLEKREEEIIQKRQKLADELQALRDTRASLERSEKLQKHSEGHEKMTIKEMVRSVLNHNAEGGTSDQIINWIHKMHGAEVARTSLSPQLSRLKAEGEIALNEDTGIWQLSGPNLLYEDRSRSHEQHRNELARMMSTSRRERR